MVDLLVPLSIAFGATVAWGLPMVMIVCPGCKPAVRIALVCTTGFVMTILLRFVLGVLGLLDAFWLLALLFFGVWFLAWVHGKHSFRTKLRQKLARTLTQPTIYFFGLIAVLSLAAASPLMTPLQKVGADSYLDFAHRDNFFHLTRAAILGVQVPPYTNPNLSGTKPLLYPDYLHAWMGMVIHDARVSASLVYFQVTPVFLIFVTLINLYAVGKWMAGSTLGGYIAAALGYIVFVPDPWDHNLLLRNVLVTQRTAYETHFFDLRYNLSNVAGSLLFTALVLILLAHHKEQDTRTRIGLLTLGSLIVVALVRVRSNYFVPVASIYVLYLVWKLFSTRAQVYIVPPATFCLLFLFVFVESTSPTYDASSATLAIDYGRFGMSLQDSFPAWLNFWVTRGPPLLAPLVYELLYVGLVSFGLLFLITFVLWSLPYAFGKKRIDSPNLFLVLVLIGTITAASFLVIQGTDVDDGNWGPQAFYLLPRIGLLFAIVPLHEIIRRLLERVRVSLRYKTAAAVAFLVVCAFIAFRAADATLHKIPERALPLTGQELNIYNWIRLTTAPKAVVAANPNHRVNAYRETVATTNLLSGMTERPSYIQRDALSLQSKEGLRRDANLQKLFSSESADEVNAVLAQMNFDYLVVYPDTPPKFDPGCCLKLIFDGKTKLYAKTP